METTRKFSYSGKDGLVIYFNGKPDVIVWFGVSAQVSAWSAAVQKAAGII